MSKAFAALVDWGTSNLRIWLVDADGQVLGERQSPEGMQGLAREQFAGVLDGHLTALDAADNLPVMIAGMAGARTGWIEAPYLDAPARLVFVAEGAVRAPHDRRTVYILPGVCQRAPLPYDVMRGEETQLAGAAASGHGDGVFCLPGTHSKWAMLQNGVLQRFTTVMTGELFDLLGRQSILRLSVDASVSTTPDNPTFAEAVREALEPGFSLTSALFSIRAGGLLADLPPTAATSRLSGLLIGQEIAAARQAYNDNGPVRLVGSVRLCALYGEALRLAGRTFEVLDGSVLVRAGLFTAAKLKFSN
ncbi:2-dehydro-3-deoxygalactonokinase [Pseudomonas sp. R2.Fl]|nr:2-dehydro-3-deoxygalactonokinase [Pseudomonas sp. R2.Fl]